MKALYTSAALILIVSLVHAQPQIYVSPPSFTVSAYQNQGVTDTLIIGNAGDAPLTFQIREEAGGLDETTRILAWTRYCDMDGEWIHTVEAIEMYLIDYTLDTTTTENPSVLSLLLEDKTTFLIPEQENAGDLYSLGQSWSAILAEFVENGGSIVALDHVNDTAPLINGSALLDINILGNSGSTTPVHILDLQHPFSTGMPEYFDVMDGWNHHTSTLGSCLVQYNSYNNLTYRYLGDGVIAYWGVDFFLYNNDMAMMLCNMLRWNGGVWWMQIGQAQGQVSPGQLLRIPASFSPGFMDPGTYSGNFIIDSNDPVTPSVSVPCELEVRSGTTPSVLVTLTPFIYQLQIPASGGYFEYNIAATNTESTSQNFTIWCMLTLPDGSQTGPLLGPAAVTLPGNTMIERDRTQEIAGSSPPGEYAYTAYVGSYPGYWDSDSFTFVKLDTDTGDEWVEGWLNYGEPFDAADAITSLYRPDEYALAEVYPNPFNPTTTIRFTMPDADNVTLTIYDISAREVVRLVDGFRDAGVHEVTFDGSALASGIYIYRITAGEFSASAKMVLMK